MEWVRDEVHFSVRDGEVYRADLAVSYSVSDAAYPLQYLLSFPWVILDLEDTDDTQEHHACAFNLDTVPGMRAWLATEPDRSMSTMVDYLSRLEDRNCRRLLRNYLENEYSHVMSFSRTYKPKVY